jgi:plastocyanin
VAIFLIDEILVMLLFKIKPFILMKAKYLFAVLFLISGAVFTNSSCSKDSYHSSSNPPSGTKTVSIGSAGFSPGRLTVNAGATVKWTNNDVIDHTVTSDDGTSFNSGNLAAGASYTYQFMTSGTYNYHCALHPEQKGSIIVVTGSSNY